MKYFFSNKVNNAEFAYPINDLIDLAKAKQLTEIDIIPAIPDIGGSFFFCKENYEVGVRGNCQGCENYKARNGKNGICKFWAYSYSPDCSNKKTIKID